MLSLMRCLCQNADFQLIKRVKEDKHFIWNYVAKTILWSDLSESGQFLKGRNTNDPQLKFDELPADWGDERNKLEIGTKAKCIHCNDWGREGGSGDTQEGIAASQETTGEESIGRAQVPLHRTRKKDTILSPRSAGSTSMSPRGTYTELFWSWMNRAIFFNICNTNKRAVSKASWPNEKWSSFSPHFNTLPGAILPSMILQEIQTCMHWSRITSTKLQKIPL